jgi:zinc D-Ala-D-Ala carboxypeptidase
MAKISRRFHLNRLLRSETAERRRIANKPAARHLRRLGRIARALDRIEKALGQRLQVNSGYRSEALNRAVGGVSTSQHTRGEAVDIECRAYGSPLELARAIVRAGVRFDQLVYEYGCNAQGGWVHLSISARPRRRTLTICSTRSGYHLGLQPCRCS